LDPTEGRYAEIAREMVTSGDWVVPHLDPGQPFWGKPPLMFWATSISFHLFGFTEFAARLPSFAMAAFTAFLTFLLAAELKDRRFALECVLVLTSTGLFYVYAGYVATDPGLLSTVTLAMVSFPLALRATNRARGKLWGYLFFAGLGLSCLAKGLVGPVLVVSTTFIWTAYTRNRRLVYKQLPWLAGTLLFLAIAIPWHVLCEVKSPGFLRYYFIGEHLKRFTVSGWEGDLYGDPHHYPPGTIWPFLFLTTLPWSSIVAFALLHRRLRSREVERRKEGPWRDYLLFWCFVPICFFTFSRNIMFTYCLPSFPPFAVLVLETLLQAKNRTTASTPAWFVWPKTIAASVLLVPLVFFLAAFTFLPEVAERKSQRDLTELFASLDRDRDATLIYFDHRPYSGDFYMRGKAIEIEDENPDFIRLELRDPDQDYYVLKDGDLDELPVEALQLTTEVGRFGRYGLRREFDLGDLDLDGVDFVYQE